MQLTKLGPPSDVLATVLNFSNRPESLGSNNTLITSDFPHYVRKRIEAEFGGMAIWIGGALGVLQSPLDLDVLDPVTNLPAVRRTFRFAEVYGQALADRAIAAIDVQEAWDPQHQRLHLHRRIPWPPVWITRTFASPLLSG